MAGLIKKQILKHLSKFAKNLSADKINLSTLRGEGELSNLELDCVALQNLMNLPTWLEIKCAKCNRVYVKMPWTKLKTSPICIVLDNVEVDMSTCEKPREPNGPSPIQASASGGDTSYGFTEKVLEGITVTINSISVNFTSAAFNATFQLSQLLVVSTNPKWEKTDLRFSRIQDKTLGQVLTFKKISWQTMRIVANAITTGDKNAITPLRLITNQSEIRMTFRRKTSDCSVLASRLHIHFDDLLWVLTDSQVQSALLCVKSLRDTIERSSQQMRELGLDKAPDVQQPNPPSGNVADTDDQYTSKYFHEHTVIETSFHIDFDNVDLHVCEESSPIHKASSKMGLQGGAIQISLHNLKVDHYPYHKAASDRCHFRDSGDTMVERDSWAQGIIKQFRHDFAVLRKNADMAGNLNTSTKNKKPTRLVENCLSVRLTDIDIHQVTTSNSRKQSSGRLINSTRKALHLPEEMPLFHFIRTEYYYPDGRDFPAPHDNIFMQINAPQLHAHWDSLIWLNRLSTVTVQAVQKMLEDLGIISDMNEGDTTEDRPASSTEDEKHTDIRIQVLMPKVFIPGPVSTHSKQPHGLEIQASKVAVTNCREGTDCARIQLKNILNKMDKQHFARNPDAFPSETDVDLPHLQDILRSHASGRDNPLNITLRSEVPTLTKSALLASATKDVWSVDLDNLWIDFVMPSERKLNEQESPSGGFLGLSKTDDDPVASGTRVPFIDSFPTQLWIGKSIAAPEKNVKIASPCNLPDVSPILSSSTSTSNLASPLQENFSMDYGKVNGHERVPSAAGSVEPSASSSSIDSLENRTASPRSVRNKNLLEYYRSSMENINKQLEQDNISHDRVSPSSTSSTSRSKVISTYILVHTDKSVRLQLDHHQYLYLLRLIDTVEEIGKKVDETSKEILSSTPSSASSTPSHSAKSHSVTSFRTLKKANPVNTTSVRLSAPVADLFLILRPPPPNVRKDVSQDSLCEDLKGKMSLKDSSFSDTSGSVKSENIAIGDDSKLPTEKVQQKLPRSVQHTPPLSECGSDTLSMQGSDNISIFGDSFTSQGAVYLHNNIANNSYNSTPLAAASSPYRNESSDNEDIPLIPRDEASVAVAQVLAPESSSMQDVRVSALKQKSGSFSALPCSDLRGISNAFKEQNANKLPHRNFSSDNLRGSVSMSDQTLHLTNTNASKSNSSGYESGSHESLPLPATVKNSTDIAPCHSHSSSDASDQFVMIQVDDNGKGTGEFTGVRLSKKNTTTSSSSGLASDTSSLSSQGLPSVEQISSKSELELDESLSTCGMADSQITVTNIETASLSSANAYEEESSIQEEVEKKEEEPEMSSLTHLHISEGVELAIDSNDAGDNIVKIVACVANVLELGNRKTDKNDSIFTDYSPKKCVSLLKKLSPGSRRDQSPSFCLRVDSGPLARRFTPAAAKVGHIQISANNVPLTLKSSTLANLGAFVEDEVVPDIVPMKIEAADVKLTIKDDMAPAYEATPPTEPITLHIHSATVTRSDDGTFHVTTSSSGGKDLLSSAFKNLPSNETSHSKAVDLEKNLENIDILSTNPQSLESSESLKTDVPFSCSVPHESKQCNGGTVSHSDCAIGGKGATVGNPDCAIGEEKIVNGGANGDTTEMQSVIDDLTKKLRDAELERDSLTAALRLVQEDLISSERERSNLRAQSN